MHSFLCDSLLYTSAAEPWPCIQRKKPFSQNTRTNKVYPLSSKINSIRPCEEMRTVFILAATVAACMCSEAGLGKGTKVSPNVSSSQSNLQKTGDDQKSAGGSTQDGRKDRKKDVFAMCRGRTPVEEKYHGFLKEFKKNKKNAVQKICERFQKDGKLLRPTLDDICSPGKGPILESDESDRIKGIFCYILLGQGVSWESLFINEEAAERAYSTVALYAAKHPVHKTVNEVLDALQEIYRKFWWSGSNDSQGASGLLEGSQKKENKEGATETKWQGMTLDERVYHSFAAGFYDNEKSKLQKMCKRLKKREERIDRLCADSPREERNRSLRSNLCYIIGLEMEEGIQDETIKRSLKVVTSFERKHSVDARVGKVFDIIRKIVSELRWDLDKPKDTSELASTDQEACEGGGAGTSSSPLSVI
jgi:hypothetical protein